MSLSVAAPAAPDGGNGNHQGHCSRCHRVWTLKERQGVCRWCGNSASCQSTTAKPRHIKSRSNGRRKQPDGNGNGYDQLDGDWLSYYKVASRFNHKAKAEDTEDLLHDIMLTLALAEQNNGHKPFTEAVMYRIASRAQADYWRAYYKLTMGLDCRHCNKAQRQKCRSEDLYSQCPKAIKLESLNKPILDGEGNLTELGELIADDKAIDLDAWIDARTWLLGCPKRLVQIASKRLKGLLLEPKEKMYLQRFRQREQKSFI